MTLGEIGLFVSIALGLAGLATAILRVAAIIIGMRTELNNVKEDVAANTEQLRRVSDLAVKVDAIWEAFMRRAVAEAVAKGVATVNSPIRVSQTAMRWLDNLRDDLANVAAAVGYEVSDKELALAIEQQLGDRILEDICIPRGLWAGACLVIALAVAREAYRDRMGLPHPEDPPSTIIKRQGG